MKTASVIDLPRETLDPKTWDTSKKPSPLLPQHREFILKNLHDYLKSVGIEGNEQWVNFLYADGSLLTYQWADDSDFDTYMLINWDMFRAANVGLMLELMSNNDIASLLTKLFRKSLDGKLLPGTNHPVTYYVRGDELRQSSDAIYDILNNKWLREPPQLPEEYDPEEHFKDVWQSVLKYAKDLDEKIGEVKRDIIDYEKFKEALQYTPYEDGKKYKFIEKKLNKKLKEINDEITDLMKEFEEIHEQRKEEFLKEDAESAVELWKWSKSWAPGNLQYKFLERYKYIALLHAIKQIYAASEDEIKEEDIPKLKEVLLRGSLEDSKAVLLEYYNKLARRGMVKRAGLISEFDLSLIESGINIMSPIMFLSGNPILIMIIMILKKLVEKARAKMQEKGKSELRDEELGIRSLEELKY